MSAGEHDENQEKTLASDVQITTESDCLESGSLFNSKYRVVQLLGQGGMSSVYQVEDIVLKRMVALKILHANSLGSDNAVLRFQQEARAVSMLKHPCIVTIHEFGVSSNGQPFLVMDYVDGVSLSEEIATKAPLPLVRMIKIISAVCDALAEAHGQGIVHRDIKPSNIMLMLAKDGSDSIKLVDFGIAKMTVEGFGDQVQLTQTGEVFGSPLYMSPEQCQGLEVDARSDIYAVGCVLYDGLCGHPPFVGTNALATLQQHINAEPDPITEIRDADGKQISQMQKILSDLLAKNPDQRYQNVGAIKRDLDEVLAGRSVKTDIRRRSGQGQLWAIGILVVAVVLLFIRLMWWQAPTKVPDQPAVTAVTPPVILSEDQQRQRWAAEDIAGQKDFDQGKLQSAKQHFLTALDEANRCVKDREQIRATAIGELCDLAAVMHDDSASSNYLREEKFLQARFLQEKLRRMNPMLRQLRKAIKGKTPKNEAERAQVDELIARAHAFAVECDEDGQFDLLQEFSRYIEDACAVTKNDLQIATTDITIGRLLSPHTNLRKESQQLLKDGLALRKKHLPPFDPDLGRAFYELGFAQLIWHDRDSVKNLDSAFGIYSRAFGPASSRTGVVVAGLAQGCKQLKDKVQSRHYAKLAVQILNHVQRSDAGYGELIARLGESYICLDMVPEACEAFQRGVDYVETAVDTRPRIFVCESLEPLQTIKERQGQTEEAKAIAARRAAILESRDRLQEYLLPKTLAAFK